MSNPSPLTEEAEAQPAFTPPLLSCLVFLTRYFEQPRSADALRAGLPEASGDFDHSLFQRPRHASALARDGSSAR